MDRPVNMFTITGLAESQKSSWFVQIYKDGTRLALNIKDMECANHYFQECTIIQITLHLGKNHFF